MDTGVFGPTNDEAICGLEEDCKQFHKSIGEPYPLRGKLNMARVKSSNDWPKLKAKAAPTRHVLKYALHLAESHNTLSVHDRQRLAVCKLLNRFYDILREEDRFVSDSAKLELPKLVQSFMIIYGKLSREALTARLRRWKFAQKFHLFQHLAEIQIILFGNARAFWTYSDEDFQRIIKHIALSCHPSTVCENVLHKWACDIFGDAG